jgi:hypothetical protein
MSSITPPSHDEFQLLCALAGAQLSQDRIERITNWNYSTLDWAEFLSTADYHGVFPLAARNLIHIDVSQIPTQVEHSLRSGYEENLRRNLWFSSELTRIMQHLERSRLQVVPFKGPVLAQAIYGDLGLRNFSDLDFLISPADFEPAKRALAEIGYYPSADLAPIVEQFWLRKGYERSFDGAAGKNIIELQWALQPHFYAIDLRVADLQARRQEMDIGGSKLPCLSPEDSLLVLCLHAAKHLWTRLIWLVDIAETLRTHVVDTQVIDYSAVFSRARDLGGLRILGISFWLVKNVLQAEIPRPAEELISSDAQVPALGRQFADRLAASANYDFESTEYFRLTLKLRERPSDRARYLWRLVSTPGSGDIAAIRLPDAFFPLYRIVRVGRLMRKMVRSSV